MCTYSLGNSWLWHLNLCMMILLRIIALVFGRGLWLSILLPRLYYYDWWFFHSLLRTILVRGGRSWFKDNLRWSWLWRSCFNGLNVVFFALLKLWCELLLYLYTLLYCLNPDLLFQLLCYEIVQFKPTFWCICSFFLLLELLILNLIALSLNFILHLADLLNIHIILFELVLPICLSN